MTVALPHLNVFEGFQFADVFAEEQQIQGEIVPLAVGGGQNAHGGEQLVGFQEVGVTVAQERTQAGVDDCRDQCDEQNQVDEAGRGKTKAVVVKVLESSRHGASPPQYLSREKTPTAISLHCTLSGM